MSFLFALSLKALHPSSPPTSTTPQDHFDNDQGARRPLTRNHPAASSSALTLASPFKTPSKSPSAPDTTSLYAQADEHCPANHGEAAESSAMAQRRAERSTSVVTTDSGYQADESGEDKHEIASGSDADTCTKIDFLTHLPHEVAVLILLHLPTHRELLDAGMVSSSWKAIADDSLIWRHFFHRNPGWALKDEQDVEEYLAAIPHDQQQGLLLPAADKGGWQDEDLEQFGGMTFDEPNAGERLTTPTKTHKGRAPSMALHSLQLSLPLNCSPSGGRQDSPLSKWTTPTPSGKTSERHHPQPIETSQQRLMSRLDWRRVYTARYRLASRFGEVGRSQGKGSARATRKEERESRCREDWEDDDRPRQAAGLTKTSSSLSSLEDDGNTDDEEGNARRRAEEESHVAASTHTPSMSRHALTRQTDGGSPSTRLSPRPRPVSIRRFRSHLDYIYCLRIFPSYRSYSPTLGNLVTGSKDHTMKVWDIQSGKLLHVLKGHAGSVLALDVDAGGEILVSGSSDRMLGIWNWFGCPEAVTAAREGRPWTPRLLDRWDCHVPVMDVRLTEQYLVLGLRNGQVRAYTRHPTRRAEFKKCSVYKDQLCSLNDMKVQGHFVAAGFAMGATELIDLRTGNSVRTFLHSKGVACVEYDGDILIAGASDGIIRCWHAPTGQLLLVLSGHEQLPRSLFFDKARGMLISVGYDGIINIWDVTLLIDDQIVEQSALGESWNCLAMQLGKQKRWIEEAVQRRELDLERIRERVNGRETNGEEAGAGAGLSLEATTSLSSSMEVRQGAGAIDTARSSETIAGGAAKGAPRPPLPHPLADPPRPYKPRFSTRQLQAPVQYPANLRESSSTGTPIPAPPAPLSSACRLFDVAFDGKRLITVGDLREVTIYDFLHEGEERDWLGWEIFR